MRHLLPIGDDIVAISAILEANGGEINEESDAAFLAWAESVHLEEGEKLDRYYAMIVTLESREELYKAEAKKLADGAASCARQVKSLKDMLRYHMNKTGRTKLESAIGRKFWIQANGGSKPVLLLPGVTVEDIPEGFVRITKTIDIKKLAEAMDADPESVPFAEFGSRGESLRIK